MKIAVTLKEFSITLFCSGDIMNWNESLITELCHDDEFELNEFSAIINKYKYYGRYRLHAQENCYYSIHKFYKLPIHFDSLFITLTPLEKLELAHRLEDTFKDIMRLK